MAAIEQCDELDKEQIAVYMISDQTKVQYCRMDKYKDDLV